MPSKQGYGSAPAEEKETKKTPTIIYVIIACFVLCGTFSTMSGKLLFQSQAKGSDGVMKHFEKPLFQNTGMFVGMTFCLVPFFFQECMSRRNDPQGLPLLSGEKRRGSDKRIYYLVALPAICDFVATYMMNIGLLWINASIWQMVRGSIVFFVAMIRWGWLKRPIFSYQWFGVFTVMCALCVIGGSAIMGGSQAQGQHVSTTSEKILGVLLVFFAQMVQATQAVAEEHLLHDVNASAMQVVGLEGLWGLVLCIGIAMPVCAYIDTPGLHEDTWDTIAMIRNGGMSILPLIALYCGVIIGFNIFAMKITEHLNSVTRSILDTVRTIFIWTMMTVLHYTVSESFGEPWNSWCWMQLGGFTILMLGLFTYYQVVRLPGFEYPKEEVAQKEPALATPTLTPSARKLDRKALPPALTPGSPRI